MPPARFSSTAVSWYLLEGGVRQQPQVTTDRAIQVNSEWGKLSPAEAWENRGYVLEQMKRYDEALKSYNKALQIKPDLQTVINKRQRSLNLLGR
ncbi:tetratricopeptide repeat protein [Scytonema sp. PRP1]|uniref:tetratricopeptide repeat protein n=1 Tax=Scytonema sp. PRP1 TaxID=3120513 RepID=UPI002FD5D204